MSLLTGLVHYWKLDEASGNRADTVGGNTLTEQTAVASAAGKIGNAGDFVPNAGFQLTSPAPGAGDFSVQAWVRPVGVIAARMAILFQGAGAATLPGFWISVRASGAVECFFNDDAGLTRLAPLSNAGAVATGVWSHIVCTFDRDGLLTFYVNGVAQGTADISSKQGSANAAPGARIGKSSVAGNPWTGQLDEIGFWTRLLSAAEVGFLFNGADAIGGDGFPYPFVVPVWTPEADPITGERWEAVTGEAPWASVSGERWMPVDGGAPWEVIMGSPAA